MGIVFRNLEAKERDFGIFIWHRFVYVMACGYRESTGFFTTSRNGTLLQTPLIMLFMISCISRKSNALFFLHSHLEAQEAFGIYSFAQRCHGVAGGLD